MRSYLCYLRRRKCLLYILSFSIDLGLKIFFLHRQLFLVILLIFPNYICFLFFFFLFLIILPAGLGLKFSLLSFSIKNASDFLSKIIFFYDFFTFGVHFFDSDFNLFTLELNLFASEVSLHTLVLIFLPYR